MKYTEKCHDSRFCRRSNKPWSVVESRMHANSFHGNGFVKRRWFFSSHIGLPAGWADIKSIRTIKGHRSGVQGVNIWLLVIGRFFNLKKTKIFPKLFWILDKKWEISLIRHFISQNCPSMHLKWMASLSPSYHIHTFTVNISYVKMNSSGASFNGISEWKLNLHILMKLFNATFWKTWKNGGVLFEREGNFRVFRHWLFQLESKCVRMFTFRSLESEIKDWTHLMLNVLGNICKIYGLYEHK